MALTKEAREFFAKEGKRGGKLGASRMTAEERRKRAQSGAAARWAKQKKAAK